jgi:hypothetical protein
MLFGEHQMQNKNPAMQSLYIVLNLRRKVDNGALLYRCRLLCHLLTRTQRTSQVIMQVDRKHY